MTLIDFVEMLLQFSFDSCKFKVQKSKEGTGRIVVWNYGIMNSFTMEVKDSLTSHIDIILNHDALEYYRNELSDYPSSSWLMALYYIRNIGFALWHLNAVAIRIHAVYYDIQFWLIWYSVSDNLCSRPLSVGPPLARKGAFILAPLTLSRWATISVTRCWITVILITLRY